MGDFTSADREKLIETHTLVKTMVDRIDDFEDRSDKRFDDHETRIRHGEGIMLKATGAGGVLGALITYVAQKLPF